MSRKLPARPNLEHLRTQAKTLLGKLRDGDAASAKAFVEYLPEAASLSPAEFRLADAQAVIARKTGFAAWPGLARHVDCLRRMEGTWTFRSLEVDGQTIPSAMLAHSLILIDGDRFRMESPEANYEGIFTIDVEPDPQRPEPQRIDIDFVEGPEAGQRCEGLFQLDGDQLTFCLGLVGSSRPAQFATSPGSGHALEVLVRADAGRPPGVDGGKPSAVVPLPVLVADPDGFVAVLTPTLEKLQGEWVPLELVNSGKPLQASYLPYGSRSHTGVETKVVFGGQTMVHAKVRFNEGVMPVEVDYFNLTGKGQGLVSLGLFRWDDGEAVFCMGAPGAGRPSDFSCTAGSGRIFSRWRRKG